MIKFLNKCVPFSARIAAKRLISPIYERPPTTMYAGLQRLKGDGFHPQTVLDVGAAVGGWTEWCLVYFPKANYLLFEPLEENRLRLERLKKEYKNIDYVLAAAGDKSGRIGFDITDNLTGSQVSDGPEGDRVVTLTTIDDEVDKRQLKGPILLKFDTHGFEIPILKGAQKVLQQTEVAIIEVYNFKIGASCVRFPDFCKYMEDLGFRVFDILDPVLRPGDQALWQMDFVFRRATYPSYSRNTYRP